MNGIIQSQWSEINRALQGDEQLRRDQLLLHEQLSEQNRDLREAHMKSLNEMEELKRFQGSTFDEFSRRRLIENQDTINVLTARIQELHNEVSCLNDSRDFKDAESVRSGLSHVPSQPALLPPVRDPGGMLSQYSVGNAEPQRQAARHLGHAWFFGNRFVKPPASSSSPYPEGFNPWISVTSEHTSQHVMSEGQTPDTTLDPRCQSGPSARNSFDPNEGRFSKDYGADQQKTAYFRSSFRQIPHTSHVCVLEDKIQNWGMYLFTTSYGSYAVDQRSGVGGISGWSQISVFYQRNSWTRLWGTRRENCFSTEQNHPKFPLQDKGQSGANESS